MVLMRTGLTIGSDSALALEFGTLSAGLALAALVRAVDASSVIGCAPPASPAAAAALFALELAGLSAELACSAESPEISIVCTSAGDACCSQDSLDRGGLLAPDFSGPSPCTARGCSAGA